jgi:hypothetical protein
MLAVVGETVTLTPVVAGGLLLPPPHPAQTRTATVISGRNSFMRSPLEFCRLYPENLSEPRGIGNGWLNEKKIAESPERFDKTAALCANRHTGYFQ